MKFQYSEKKVRLPENVHAYAEKKVMKLARFFEEDAEALIVFSVEKNRNNVELTVHGAGTWFRASESTSDMFASIDAAVGTIEGQIRKNKTRLARRLRQDAFARTAEETSFVADEPEEELTIVRAKKFYMRPMTREEAILQMYQAIAPSMKSVLQCLICFNLPFTIVKGLIAVVICMLIYKPLSPVLKGRLSE